MFRSRRSPFGFIPTLPDSVCPASFCIGHFHQTVQVFHRIHAREPQFESPLVVFPEHGFSAVIVESVAAAFFENEQASYRIPQALLVSNLFVCAGH